MKWQCKPETTWWSWWAKAPDRAYFINAVLCSSTSNGRRSSPTMIPWWDSPRVSKILMAFPGFKHCSCQSWWRKHTFLHGNAEKNREFCCSGPQWHPKIHEGTDPMLGMQHRLLPQGKFYSCLMTRISPQPRLALKYLNRYPPTIGFSPIKTHLWTCRFSAFFSWQLSLHCSPMPKRFSEADSVFRLRGPAMKDGTTKIIQRLFGGMHPASLGEIVEYETTKTKSLPLLFFGTEHVRLKTHM